MKERIDESRSRAEAAGGVGARLLRVLQAGVARDLLGAQLARLGAAQPGQQVEAVRQKAARHRAAARAYGSHHGALQNLAVQRPGQREEQRRLAAHAGGNALAWHVALLGSHVEQQLAPRTGQERPLHVGPVPQGCDEGLILRQNVVLGGRELELVHQLKGAEVALQVWAAGVRAARMEIGEAHILAGCTDGQRAWGRALSPDQLALGM